MGRKPKASSKVESANPSLVARKSMQTNLAMEGEKSEVEKQKNPALEGETQELEMQAIRSSLPSSTKGAKKNQTIIVRRSGRLQSTFPPAQRNNVQLAIEEIDISESEKEDEPVPLVYEQDKCHEPTQGKESLEEKLDSILEALKSKGPVSQGPSRTDVQYRSLYFESQKKIETLTDEKFQLTMKLENALGKLEVYEKGRHLLSEALEKLKDVILISNMSKATEAVINLSSQAIHGSVPSSDAVIGAKTLPAKRKKPANDGKEKQDSQLRLFE